MGTKFARGRTGRAGLIALVVTVSLAGCSWVKDPDADQPDAETSASTSAQPLPDERPTAVPTAFNSPGSTTFAETGVLAVGAGEDTVITVSAGSAIGRVLPSLKSAYTLTTTDGQFTDLEVDRAAGVGILLEAANEAGSGTYIGEDTFTITRFDLQSGELLDVATAVLPQDPEGEALPATARIAGVTGDVVVIETAVGQTGSRAALAVDIELDDVLWRQRPARVLDVTDDVVVLNTGLAQRPGAVEAVGLESGDPEWRSLRGTVDATAIGHTDDAVTVVRSLGAGTEPAIVPLDLETGEPGAPTETARWNWACGATSGTVRVCTMADDDDVVGWDLETGEPAWSLPDEERFAPLVTLVQDDLVYGILDSGVGVVLNARTGADVASDTGAGPVAVNDWGGVLLYQDVAVFLPAFEAGDSTDPGSTPSGADGSESPSESPSESLSDEPASQSPSPTGTVSPEG
ncbi:hypothetical protein SAMN05421872_10582 [Nocardioides lianchengensis]|uniref:PQQ-like domain-containing protein n=1 Tax=Nocardioides lianchengensis TaxID=1045774 RepID=A0A1G6QYJ7_9ACTN|nr:hypothetical protein SAMN05421872_10582 [Nocardioides lianchengensis]